MTEQPPDTFSAEAIASAAAAALELERDAPPSLHGFGAHLAAAAKERMPDPEGWLLMADAEVCGLEVLLSERAAAEGTPLGPVHGFPDALTSYFEARVTATTRSDAAGRYGDFLWLRWRIGIRGIAAVPRLLEHAASLDRSDDDQQQEGLGAVLRAVDLSIRLNASRPEVAAYADEEIRRLVAEDSTLAVLELVNVSRALLALEPDRATNLLDHLEERAAAETHEFGHRQLLEAVEGLARSLGDTDRAAAAKRAAATRLEDIANQSQGLARLMRLREADKLFAELNDGEALARIRSAREEAGREALGEMRSFEKVVTVPREAIERSVDQLTMAKGDHIGGLFTLASDLGIWVRWTSVRSARQQSDADHPFAALAEHVSLEGDGRTQPDPDREEDAEDFELARDIAYYNRQVQERAAHLMMMLTELRHRGLWSAPHLEAVLSIADDDLGLACSPGLVRFEVGDDWSALHVLVPQLERALRLIGQQVGARVSTRNRIGGIEWAPMNVLLEQPGIRNAMGEDVASEMDMIFCDPYGLNIRNNVAHGAYALDANAHGAAILTILTLLTLAYVAAVLRRVAEASGTAARDDAHDGSAT